MCPKRFCAPGKYFVRHLGHVCNSCLFYPLVKVAIILIITVIIVCVPYWLRFFVTRPFDRGWVSVTD